MIVVELLTVAPFVGAEMETVGLVTSALVHALVTNAQLLEQVRVPPENPKVLQVAPFKSLPSQDSPVSAMPFPQNALGGVYAPGRLVITVKLSTQKD